MLYIVINVFIGGPIENQLVEGQPSLKELDMNIYEKHSFKSRKKRARYQCRWSDPRMLAVIIR